MVIAWHSVNILALLWYMQNPTLMKLLYIVCTAFLQGPDVFRLYGRLINVSAETGKFLSLSTVHLSVLCFLDF